MSHEETTPQLDLPHDPEATARSERLIDERAVALQTRLCGAGIGSLMLEGRATEVWLYPDRVRGYTRVDLLVGPAEHAAAIEVLRSDSYRLGARDQSEPSGHAVTLRPDEDEPITLAVHRSFGGVGDVRALWRELWSESERFPLGSGRVSVPGAIGRLLIAAFRAAAPSAPIASTDLERALAKRPAAEWLSARRMAGRCDAGSLFDAGLGSVEPGRSLMQSCGIGGDGVEGQSPAVTQPSRAMMPPSHGSRFRSFLGS